MPGWFRLFREVEQANDAGYPLAALKPPPLICSPCSWSAAPPPPSPLLPSSAPLQGETLAPGVPVRVCQRFTPADPSMPPFVKLAGKRGWWVPVMGKNRVGVSPATRR